MPIQTAADSISNSAGSPYGFKNRIINGAMVIDQRNAGASVTPVNNQYLVDRFLATLTQASKFTVQQNAGSVTPPTGFIKYLGVTSLSSYTVLAGDYFLVEQRKSVKRDYLEIAIIYAAIFLMIWIISLWF